MLLVDSPKHDHKVLITKHGEVSDGEFLDPRGGQVIMFDHIKRVSSRSPQKKRKKKKQLLIEINFSNRLIIMNLINFFLKKKNSK